MAPSVAVARFLTDLGVTPPTTVKDRFMSEVTPEPTVDPVGDTPDAPVVDEKAYAVHAGNGSHLGVYVGDWAFDDARNRASNVGEGAFVVELPIVARFF